MKISQLTKAQISNINKFLKKNNAKPFLSKEIKAIDKDELDLIYFHDELIVRGTLHLFNSDQKYYVLAIKHGLELTDCLILDSSYTPVRIEECFNLFHDTI